MARHRKQQRDRLITAQHRYTEKDWGRLSPTAIDLEIKDGSTDCVQVGPETHLNTGINTCSEDWKFRGIGWG